MSSSDVMDRLEKLTSSMDEKCKKMKFLQEKLEKLDQTERKLLALKAKQSYLSRLNYQIANLQYKLAVILEKQDEERNTDTKLTKEISFLKEMNKEDEKSCQDLKTMTTFAQLDIFVESSIHIDRCNIVHENNTMLWEELLSYKSEYDHSQKISFIQQDLDGLKFQLDEKRREYQMINRDLETTKQAYNSITNQIFHF